MKGSDKVIAALDTRPADGLTAIKQLGLRNYLVEQME
jgi:hypothetical protein